MTLNIVGIVQARLGSTRLPGKVLLPIQDRPLIRHVVERCTASKRIDRMVVATTKEPEDDSLAQYISSELKVEVFRGATDDVLARFVDAAKQSNADIIVRITADDPLKDREIIDLAVDAMLADSALDYCSNTLVPSFPEGLDIEVFRASALERAGREAELASEREHVTPYIWKNQHRFCCRNLLHSEDLSGMRLTVDKPTDLELMRIIFAELGGRDNLFSWRDVIALLKRSPELIEINAGTIRNEGYLRSVQEQQS